MEKDKTQQNEDALMMIQQIATELETNGQQNVGECKLEELFENQTPNIARAHLVDAALNQQAPQTRLKGFVGEELGPAGYETGIRGMVPMLSQPSQDNEDNDKVTIATLRPPPRKKNENDDVIKDMPRNNLFFVIRNRCKISS